MDPGLRRGDGFMSYCDKLLFSEVNFGMKNVLLKIAQSVIIRGIETKNICRIQWDVFPRHKFAIKNP